MRRVAALILAAGRGTRFAAGPDDSKLAARLDDKPLVRHVAEAALASMAHPVMVVTGHAAPRVAAALTGLDIALAHNGAYADGLSGSVKTGLAALPADIDGAVILLGDMPRITAALIDRLIAAFAAAGDDIAAVAPVHAGQRGNPVLIGRALFAALNGLTGDQGARPLLDAAGDRVLEVEVETAAIGFDVDTRATLAAAARTHS